MKDVLGEFHPWRREGEREWYKRKERKRGGLGWQGRKGVGTVCCERRKEPLWARVGARQGVIRLRVH